MTHLVRKKKPQTGSGRILSSNNVVGQPAISDFTGKKAIFKTMVSGEPAPTVTWGRNKGTMDDPLKYKSRYDARNQEHVLEVGRSIDCQTLICFVFMYFKYTA